MLLLLLGCASTPKPALESDTIYLAMVDRFQNGAVDNMPIAADDPQGWHGGDIQGTIANLDRLQALGVHTLWLTPLTASRQAPFHEWGAYHGYWPQLSLIHI